MTVDRVERTWAPGVVRSLAGALLLLVGGCAPSAESLEEKVKDEPGVITVEVMEGGGDDDLPFTRIPKSVWVLKEPDASADEVMSVFDKYDDDIDDDVDLVQVRLKGPKKSTLLAGTGIKVDRTMVEGLVEAQADDDLLRYSRTAAPVRRDVELTVVPLEFDQVVSVADRYRDDKDIDFVQIDSGQFLLIRDSVNEDLARTFGSAARARRAAIAGTSSGRHTARPL